MSLTQEQIAEFQGHHVPNPAAGVEEQVEEGIRPSILSQFGLPQQPPEDRAIRAFAGKLLPRYLLEARAGFEATIPSCTSQPKNRRTTTSVRLTVATACALSRRRYLGRSVTSQVVTRPRTNGSALAVANHQVSLRRSRTIPRRVPGAKSWLARKR